MDEERITDDSLHRFLNSDVPAAPDEPQKFEALGHAGSGNYKGLETFDNPGVYEVLYASDEVMGKCPVTGQPDFYTCKIRLRGTDKCVESKSLKLFFQNIMEKSFTEGFGIFCEALAVHIRDEVCKAIDAEEQHVTVQMEQKSRGGITITAVA